jgi:hypothetical protein
MLTAGQGIQVNVFSGTPWLVNLHGQVYQWNGSAWGDMTNGACATSIGLDNTVSGVWTPYITGCTIAATGGYDIYYLQGTTWNLLSGQGTHIDDDMWLATKLNHVYFRRSNAWQDMTSGLGSTSCGTYITGTGGSWNGGIVAFALSCEAATGGGHNLYAAAGAANGSVTWVPLNGAPTGGFNVISAGGSYLWAIDGSGNIWYASVSAL